MFNNPAIVLKNPIRRIYLFWGLIMLFGFPTAVIFPLLPFYIIWAPLAVIGLIAQLTKQPIKIANKKAIFLHTMWILVVGGGVLLNYLSLYSTIPFPYYPTHYGAVWILSMGIPQIITGYFIPLHKNIQIGLGVAWIIAGLLMEFVFSPFPVNTGFFLVALITGIPYLYIAFKK